MAQSEGEVQVPSNSQWLIETLRVTAFPKPDAEANPSDWWRQVLGQDPETQIQRQRLGELIQEGIVGGAKLALRVRPERIDWIMAPVESPEVPETFPTVGPFDDSCKKFRALINSWIPVSPPLSRIAFGAVACLPTPNHVAGYQTLSTYLPAVSIDPKSADFIYQINRPRASGVREGLSINRLSKWAVVNVQLQSFFMGSQEGTRVVRAPINIIYGCRVEIDVNTSSAYEGDFTREELQKVLGELENLAGEILREGDRP